MQGIATCLTGDYIIQKRKKKKNKQLRTDLPGSREDKS